MGRKVRIGIIGCGGIANGKHMPALKKIEEAEMVAFCDIIEERAVRQQRNSESRAQKSIRITESCSRMRASRVFMSAPRTARIRSSQ